MSAKHGDVATGPGWELRCGDYREVLTDVECDAVITDPPYSERTHAGQRHGRRAETCNGKAVSSRGIGYTHWDPGEMRELAWWSSGVSRGWVAVFSDHIGAAAYNEAFAEIGMTRFAPIACVQRGMNVRLAGDGPSNWTTWLQVARPKSLAKWGTLCGAYVGLPFDPGENSATAGRRSSVVGSKPRWLMRAIIRDYSRPGDLICDPCAGGGTTLLAAAMEGRSAIGAELDPATFELAVKRLRRVAITSPLPGMA